MAETTKIQWTDSTFNPWRGCTKISPGCAHCYAERGSKRNPAVLGVWGNNGTRVLASETQWKEVLKWEREASKRGRPIRVFCASLADVFEDWQGQLTNAQGHPIWLLPRFLGEDREPFRLEHARKQLWKLVRQTPHLIWQILTKRPDNVRSMMPEGTWPNVWLGVSVENQEYTWRMDCLQDACDNHLSVPVKFVSAEPLLGPILFGGALPAFRWVIVGGESGGKARECDLAWARSIRDQCRDAKVACFVKQLGGNRVESGSIHEVGSHLTFHGSYSLNLITDNKGGNIAEWPEDLKVREFPN